MKAVLARPFPRLLRAGRIKIHSVQFMASKRRTCTITGAYGRARLRPGLQSMHRRRPDFLESVTRGLLRYCFLFHGAIKTQTFSLTISSMTPQRVNLVLLKCGPRRSCARPFSLVGIERVLIRNTELGRAAAGELPTVGQRSERYIYVNRTARDKMDTDPSGLKTAL